MRAGWRSRWARVLFRLSLSMTACRVGGGRDLVVGARSRGHRLLPDRRSGRESGGRAGATGASARWVGPGTKRERVHGVGLGAMKGGAACMAGEARQAWTARGGSDTLEERPEQTRVVRDDEVGVRNKAARRFDVDAPVLEVVVGQSGGVAASTVPWRWTGAHTEGGGRSPTALPPLRTATNRAVSSPSSVRSDSRVGASRARSLPSM